MISVLLVDDDPAFRKILSQELVSMGFELDSAGDGRKALAQLKRRDFDVVLLDIKMPEMDGVEVLRVIKSETPLTEVVMLTGHGTLDTAVDSMKLGAYDFLTKPCQLQELQSVIEKAHEKGQLARENIFLKRQLNRRDRFGEFVGRSDNLKAVLDLVSRVAPSESTVLVQGESGVGKELVAQAIHRNSARQDGPFVVVDCCSLQEELLHSELFGHEKGSFTGAASLKHGLFEVANKGTIFLDEIGELTSTLQSKLLRVLETGTFRRLGGIKDIQVDVRIIAATNRNLQQMVSSEAFREDLFYRINVVSLVVPPLRDRREDIPMLARYFAQLASPSKSKKSIEPEAMEVLTGYEWPGNVRELQNVIERAVILCQGQTIQPGDLPGNIRLNPKSLWKSSPGSYLTLEELEKSYIVA
ncbi:MAG: sigma-54-dependent transcriptional regulator, partial [Acidobacteriota bacterium]